MTRKGTLKLSENAEPCLGHFIDQDTYYGAIERQCPDFMYGEFSRLGHLSDQDTPCSGSGVPIARGLTRRRREWELTMRGWIQTDAFWFRELGNGTEWNYGGMWKMVRHPYQS